MEIHQILPTFSPGDAIGNEVIEINKTLRKWGYNSQIYAENIHPEMTAKKHLEYNKVSSKDNILIFHFSIGSDVSHYVAKLPDKKIIRFHGITPEKYLSGINDYIHYLLVRGREELKLYPELTDLALANSQYTQLELSNLGFKHTEIFPLLLDLNIYNKSPNENLLSRLNFLLEKVLIESSFDRASMFTPSRSSFSGDSNRTIRSLSRSLKELTARIVLALLYSSELKEQVSEPGKS